MRNGIAIAGMAGGLFFLGQAVASASDQVANAGNGTTQTNTTTDGGGSGANHNETDASAKNVDVTKVESTVTGGTGGTNSATINTGIVPGDVMAVGTQSVEHPPGDEHHGDKKSTTVTLNTGDVSLTQNANGGAVSDSGNVAVADHSGSQTATATNTVNQSNSSTGDDQHKGRDHHEDNKTSGASTLSPSTGGDEHHSDGNANHNDSDATAKNVDVTKVDTTVTGGNGGSNYADINTGIIGNTFYCPEKSTCTFNFTTGNVTVYQNANGGAVSNSGNVGVGAPVPGSCSCPEKAAAAKPAVMSASAPAAKHSAAALSSAQPSGQLAFTGSDVSLPLTVGLLTLVAGLGLTAAGRRRETQTV